MDIDTAKAMLALLLGKHWPLFGSFHQFLDVSIQSCSVAKLSVKKHMQWEPVRVVSAKQL